MGRSGGVAVRLRCHADRTVDASPNRSRWGVDRGEGEREAVVTTNVDHECDAADAVCGG